MITKTQKYLFSKLPYKLSKNIIVDLESSCWLWQVNINGSGYGRVSICTNGNKKRIAAHVHIYKLFNGAYDPKLKLDHVYCKDRNCCNPTHVSPVTQSQNTHRGKAVLYKKQNIKPFKIPIENDPDWFSDLLDQYPAYT